MVLSGWLWTNMIGLSKVILIVYTIFLCVCKFKWISLISHIDCIPVLVVIFRITYSWRGPRNCDKVCPNICCNLMRWTWTPVHKLPIPRRSNKNQKHTFVLDKACIHSGKILKLIDINVQKYLLMFAVITDVGRLVPWSFLATMKNWYFWSLFNPAIVTLWWSDVTFMF